MWVDQSVENACCLSQMSLPAFEGVRLMSRITSAKRPWCQRRPEDLSPWSARLATRTCPWSPLRSLSRACDATSTGLSLQRMCNGPYVHSPVSHLIRRLHGDPRHSFLSRAVRGPWGQGPSHGQLSCATKAGRVEKRIAHCVVGDSINNEDRHIVPELSQPLVWTCDMRHVTGQWTGKCEVCNDSRDVMQVSESILCRLINRWRMRTICCHLQSWTVPEGD